MTQPPLTTNHYRAIGIAALALSLLLLLPLLMADFAVGRLLTPAANQFHPLFQDWPITHMIQIREGNTDYCAIVRDSSKQTHPPRVAVAWVSFELSPSTVTSLARLRQKGWQLLEIRGRCDGRRRLWNPTKQIKVTKELIKQLSSKFPQYRKATYLFEGSGFTGSLAILCAEKCPPRGQRGLAIAEEPALDLRKFFNELTSKFPFDPLNALVLKRFKKYEKFNFYRNSLSRYRRKGRRPARIALLASPGEKFESYRKFCKKWGDNCRLFELPPDGSKKRVRRIETRPTEGSPSAIETRPTEGSPFAGDGEDRRNKPERPVPPTSQKATLPTPTAQGSGRPTSQKATLPTTTAQRKAPAESGTGPAVKPPLQRLKSVESVAVLSVKGLDSPKGRQKDRTRPGRPAPTSENVEKSSKTSDLWTEVEKFILRGDK